MKGRKLEQQIKVYADLAKKDKSIDVASLMISALDTKDTNTLTPGQKRLGYLVSLGVPPFGLFYAIKFWLSGKDDGQDAALICVVLTTLSIILFVVISQMIFSGSTGAQLQQVQQLKPSDIQQLYE